MSSSPIKLSGVVSFWEEKSEFLWRHCHEIPADRAIAVPLQRTLLRQVRDIDRILLRKGLTPAALALPTGRVYAALEMLSDEVLFDRAVMGLIAAKEAARGYAGKLVVSLMPMRPLWTVRRRQGRSKLKCNLGFINSSPEIWGAIVQSVVVKRTARRDQLVDEAALSNPFQEIVGRLNRWSNAVGVRGQVHDLEELFSRVNDTYFSGVLGAPDMTWSETVTVRTFGRYEFSQDRVVISASLDQPEVPEWVVEFVLYHELLHKVHGLQRRAKRNIAHTHAFKTDERRFERFDEAEQFLSQWAHKLRT